MGVNRLMKNKHMFTENQILARRFMENVWKTGGRVNLLILRFVVYNCEFWLFRCRLAFQFLSVVKWILLVHNLRLGKAQTLVQI